MPVRLTARYPTGAASSAAASAPARTASGNGRPRWIAASPVAYADVPQKAACPKDNRPVKPSRRSTETAKSAQHRMSTATAGYSPLGSQAARARPAHSSAPRSHRGAPETARKADGAAAGGVPVPASSTVDGGLVMPVTPHDRRDRRAATAAPLP